jgi:hypothetical protein
MNTAKSNNHAVTHLKNISRIGRGDALQRLPLTTDAGLTHRTVTRKFLRSPVPKRRALFQNGSCETERLVVLSGATVPRLEGYNALRKDRAKRRFKL